MNVYLKAIATVLNAVLLFAVLIILMNEPPNRLSGPQLLLILLVVITPAFTLFALFAPKEP